MVSRVREEAIESDEEEGEGEFREVKKRIADWGDEEEEEREKGRVGCFDTEEEVVVVLRKSFLALSAADLLIVNFVLFYAL